MVFHKLDPTQQVQLLRTKAKEQPAFSSKAVQAAQEVVAAAGAVQEGVVVEVEETEVPED